MGKRLHEHEEGRTQSTQLVEHDRDEDAVHDAVGRARVPHLGPLVRRRRQQQVAGDHHHEPGEHGGGRQPQPGLAQPDAREVRRQAGGGEQRGEPGPRVPVGGDGLVLRHGPRTAITLPRRSSSQGRGPARLPPPRQRRAQRARSSSTLRYRTAALARAFTASVARSRGGAVVTSESSNSCAACVTFSTARAKAASLAFEGLRRSAQLPNELQGRGMDLLVRGGRLEVVQRLDGSTHRWVLFVASPGPSAGLLASRVATDASRSASPGSGHAGPREPVLEPTVREAGP